MQGMSLCSSEGNKLIEKIDKALETSRIMKDVECFSHLDRYTSFMILDVSKALSIFSISLFPSDEQRLIPCMF